MENSVDRIEEVTNVKPYVEMFDEAEWSTLEEREQAHRCRDYVDGNQLTDEECAELARRGQPEIVINRIRRKINYLRGLEIQRRVDPKAFPRSPNAEYDANAATLAIRYVCDNNNWNRIRSYTWENMLVEGVGGVEVVHHFQPPMQEPEIKINKYAYDRIFWDPHSSEADFSDARYKGAVIWSDIGELKAQHPDKADIIDASVGPTATLQETFEDKPFYNVWSDRKRRRVKCVLLYHNENGVWKWVKFVKGGVLQQGSSTYVDDKGMSVCPLILQSLYVTRENARYGEVKDMLDPQDEINKRRSKMLHQLSSRQTWGPKGAVSSVQKMKRELAKPDGHIEIEREGIEAAAELGVSPFNIISTQDQIAGQSALLAESKAEIDLLGANSALQGVGQASSGREVIARQQGGMVELAAAQDELSNLTLQVYRQIWFMIRQFWTAPKWVRVTDDDKNQKFGALNRPIPLQERLSQMPREEVVHIARNMQLHPGDPRLQMPVGAENEVSQMDVDIILAEVDDSITLAGETFEQLVSLASSQPGSVPIEILVEAAPNLPKHLKDRIIERIEQEQQAGAEQQKRQQEIFEAQTEAEIEETYAGAMEDRAQARRHLIEAHRPAAGE